MIDPLETLIAYLRSDNAVQQKVGDRIAAKHRYGSGWQTSQPSIVVRYDGGRPDLYVARQRVQIDLRCYANTSVEAYAVYQVVESLTRRSYRVVVPTTKGNALIYRFTPQGGANLGYDDSIPSDMVLGIFMLDVAETSV
jgi:hypothetical protein